MSWENIDSRYHDTASYDGRYPPDWDARRKLVYRRDSYTCKRCGTKSGPYAGDNGPTLHAHHRTPLSCGGTNHPNNLITLCGRCHNDVHDHNIFQGASEPSQPSTDEDRPETRIGTGTSRTIAVVTQAGKVLAAGLTLFVGYLCAVWVLGVVGGNWATLGFVGLSVMMTVVCTRYPQAGSIATTVAFFWTVVFVLPGRGLIWSIVAVAYVVTGPIAGCCWAWLR